MPGIKDAMSSFGRWLIEPVSSPTSTPVRDSFGIRTGFASPWADSSHLGEVTLAKFYGLADDLDVWVDRSSAMSLSPIAKGRRVLVTNGARLKLQNKRGSAAAPLTMPYLEQPEADRPLSGTLTWTLDALMFYPRTWWIVQRRDFAGWPARGGCKLLDRKDAEFDSDGKLVAAWGDKIGPGERYEERDVIQFDAPDRGLLAEARRTIKRALILNAAAALAEGNPVPSLNLRNDGPNKLEAHQIKELLESWVDARKKYGVSYTDKGITPEAFGIANTQLLIDGRKQMDLELARHVGIPAWAADVSLEGSSLTYQNRSSRGWELIDLYLTTYLSPITSRLSMADTTPIGWSTEFGLDELTREDQKTRFETYAIGLEKGFIDQAWVEAQEGQPLKLGTGDAA